jgi:hypothetical protein
LFIIFDFINILANIFAKQMTQIYPEIIVYLLKKLPPYTLTGFDPTTQSSSLLGGMAGGDDTQGDQIGRMLAYWSVLYFGLLSEYYKSSSNYCASFSTVQVMYILF